jgi:hypothetical protein
MEQETNFIAISSFILAIFAWLTPFISTGCNNIPNIIGGGAAVTGLIGLVWLKMKNQKGGSYAILGIILGLAAYILLVSLC